MAQYKIPPDPRKNEDDGEETAVSSQWVFIGIGGVVTLVALVIGLAIINAFLFRPPLEAGLLPEPTVVRLTAPATVPPTATPAFDTPTPIPTFTPIPTPDNALAPAELTIGFYAVVANTDGIGVTVRGGPSTANQALLVAPEGELVLVLDGPQRANEFDFAWWQVRLADETEGWVAGDFIEPADAP